MGYGTGSGEEERYGQGNFSLGRAGQAEVGGSCGAVFSPVVPPTPSQPPLWGAGGGACGPAPLKR